MLPLDLEREQVKKVVQFTQLLQAHEAQVEGLGTRVSVSVAGKRK